MFQGIAQQSDGGGEQFFQWMILVEQGGEGVQAFQFLDLDIEGLGLLVDGGHGRVLVGSFRGGFRVNLLGAEPYARPTIRNLVFVLILGGHFQAVH